jgi:hypothetical protein
MIAWIKKNRLTFIRVAGSLLSGILLFFLLYQNRAEISSALKEISLVDLLLAFALILCSRLFTVARWYTLLRSGGIEISFRNTLSLTFTGLFASNFLPTTVGGDVIRLAGAMQMGYDRAVCLASIAADRLVNMAGMSLASPLGFAQMIPSGAAAVSFAISGFTDQAINFIRRTLSSLTIWVKQPQALLLALFFAMAHMLCMFTSNTILIHALGGELELWRVIGLFSLSYFIGLIPISIGGYGWQELTISSMLSTFGGIDVSISIAVAVLHRLLMMLASLPGALTVPDILAKMDRSASHE